MYMQENEVVRYILLKHLRNNSPRFPDSLYLQAEWFIVIGFALLQLSHTSAVPCFVLMNN